METASQTPAPSQRNFTLQLPVFEGPMDLLLYLVSQQEVDIWEISIAELTAQYMQALAQLQAQQQTRDIEIAGEFFVMAATLMQIKSRLLLPAEQTDGSDEGASGPDPRLELIEQLLHYQKFRNAAEELGQRMEAFSSVLPRVCPPPEVDTGGPLPLAPVDDMKLWNAFNRMLERLQSEIKGAGEIMDDSVTVSSCMEHVLAHISPQQPKTTFTALFKKPGAPRISIASLSSTFLALLELTRLGRLRLAQSANFEDIDIEHQNPEDRHTAETAEDTEDAEHPEADANPEKDNNFNG